MYYAMLYDFSYILYLFQFHFDMIFELILAWSTVITSTSIIVQVLVFYHRIKIYSSGIFSCEIA